MHVQLFLWPIAMCSYRVAEIKSTALNKFMIQEETLNTKLKNSLKVGIINVIVNKLK